MTHLVQFQRVEFQEGESRNETQAPGKLYRWKACWWKGNSKEFRGNPEGIAGKPEGAPARKRNWLEIRGKP